MIGNFEVTDVPATAVTEATGHRVKVETSDGAFFEGRLTNFDINSGNVELVDVRCQARDSALSICERLFVKGERVRMIHLPVELQRAPLLQWQRDSVQELLKKTLKPKKRAVKRTVKKHDDAETRREARKLKKLRGVGGAASS